MLSRICVSQAKAIDRGNWNALEEDLALASSSPELAASQKPGRLSVTAAESQLRSGVAAIVLAGEQVSSTAHVSPQYAVRDNGW